MKIVFVEDGIYAYASRSPSAVGGLERTQWLLSRALAAAGWSVIVAVHGSMQATEHRVIEGIEFSGMGKRHLLFELWQFLKRERPDWMYLSGANHLLGLTVEVARRAGVRTIFAFASDLDVEPCHATLYRPRWWPVYAWGLSRTDRIFVQHSGQLSRLSPRWRSKASVLPKVCLFGSNGDETLSTKSHLERANYVAWVGSLTQLRRPDLLIEIARKLPAIRFVVCGGPTLFMSAPGYGEQIINELRATANIDYLGQVAPEKAHQVIADAAILLSTSDVEGFPNTFVQAWSTGTPVVTLKIDPDHIIEQLRLGTLSGSIESAIADINGLISSPEQREEIAVRAHKHVMTAHSETEVVAAFESAVCGSRIDTSCHTNRYEPSTSP
jgi:glycosyltransferase involved in cell wall biosynthesis